MRSQRVTSAGLHALLGAVALLAHGCGPATASARPAAAPAAQAAPVEVQVEVVEPTPLVRRLYLTGTFFGEEHTSVAAKLAGRIDAVYRDVGDVVAPGAPLARIEPRDYELALSERQRAFEQTLAQLGLRELPAQDEAVAQLPAVERARLQAENAAARHERGRLLHERTPPALSDQEYADLYTAWEVAKSDLRAAVLGAQAQLAQARAILAQVATAEQRVADTLVRAPSGERPPTPGPTAAEAPSLDAIVTRRHVAVGDYVQPGSALFELVDPDPLKLRAAVPEREAANVRSGQRALVHVDTDAAAHVGRVARVNFAVDPRTRTFEVEIIVPNADRALRAGSFARAELESGVNPAALLVPRTALVTFAGIHKVYVVADGKVEERVVALGQEQDQRIEIASGLKRGETLIQVPPAGLSAGRSVRLAAGGATQ
jgi:multidrug efflux pump subunit AcrA (membrane-fusion protein)